MSTAILSNHLSIFSHMMICSSKWFLEAFQKRYYHGLVNRRLEGCAIYDIHQKRILNSDLVKSRLPITYFSVIQSFWNFAQSTLSPPCPVQNFKIIRQLARMIWTYEISRDLSLRWVVGRYPILHSLQVLSYVWLHVSEWFSMSGRILHKICQWEKRAFLVRRRTTE